MAVGVEDEQDLRPMLLRQPEELLPREGRIDNRSLMAFLVHDEVRVIVQRRGHDSFDEHGRLGKGVTCINLPAPYASFTECRASRTSDDGRWPQLQLPEVQQ